MASNTVSDSDAHWIDKSKPRWWKKLTDVDPISLEPLRQLKVAPFDLTVDGTRSSFFDGKILATYLVSTGQFAHPISRRELTRDDALRLDEHLRSTRTGKPCVTHAFDHQEDYKKKDDPENVVRRNQQEATELLRMLYSAAQERNSNGGDDDGGGRGGRGRGRGGGRGGRRRGVACNHNAFPRVGASDRAVLSMLILIFCYSRSGERSSGAHCAHSDR